MSTDNNFGSYAHVGPAIGYQDPTFDSVAEKSLSRSTHLQAGFTHSDQYNFIIDAKSYLFSAKEQHFAIESDILVYR
jgi:hypothetical protein